MRIILLLSTFVLLLSTACGKKGGESAGNKGLSCKGIYYERDSAGTLKKYNQYELNGQCYTDNLPLSQFEKTDEKWKKNNVQCTPQPSFPSRTVVAASNFYDYRDGKAYLDFDSSTGVYRRIILAEDKQGKPVYARLKGCFYQRTGTGIDAAFGSQLLLDTDINKVVSSQNFDPMEIFSYTESGADLQMLRFDDTADYDFRNCPYLNTPWKFCELLRDGNEMFFPVLPLADQTALTQEAIIISKQFNWTNSSKSTFDSLWDSKDRTEAMREDYKYDVIHIVDTPRYIDQAWRDYLMGNRPTMPNVNSQTQLNVCYQGSKNVTLADGSTGKIYGEICYDNGVYTFTQN